MLARTIALALLVPALAAAQTPAASYRLPPKEIVDLVDAPPTPGVSFSPDRKWMLILDAPSFPPISELAEPELKLGGVRFSPKTNGPTRTSFWRGITFRAAGGTIERKLTGLPEGARIGNVMWSPDSKRIAFTTTAADGISLWHADVGVFSAKPLHGITGLNQVYGAPCDWLPDSNRLLCKHVSPERGLAPKAPEVPQGPVVQESTGRKAPGRTWQDLLRSPTDEAMLDHYLQSQLMIHDLAKNQEWPIDAPAAILWVSISPDGKNALVATSVKPWSYKVPIDRFPYRIESWELGDSQPKKKTLVADIALAEEIPVTFGSVRTGPREHAWRADAPATLCWAEARDGGDAKADAKIRDEVLCQDAPFTAKPRTLATLALRYGGVTWGTDSLALVNEWWWADRHTRTWVVAPGNPAKAPEVLWDRSSEDRYGDPGDPVTEPTASGYWVLRTLGKDGRTLFLTGEGASPEGDRPFLDRLDLNTKKSTRLWRSEAPYYATVWEVLDDDAKQLIIRRESNSEPPNWLYWDVKKKKAGAALTKFPHPTPWISQVKKEFVHYKRADGLALTGSLYLPPGYDAKKDGALPTMLWVYPSEYKSADAAGQVQDSPYRFVRVGWSNAHFLLTRGWAVLDDPSVPIVGEGRTEPNDTYVEQLTDGLAAAIDALVARGVTDRERVAIGGHSYGAFTTANALAHTDLFRTGIARSGAYNRTLTPFSFQSEERTLWEAPAIYTKVSPLLVADRIDEPLLLIHGQADDNPGTWPMQSERLFEAMKGLGGTARLVQLPLESHGYRSRESVLHVLAEQVEWLDRHVTKAPPRSPKKAELAP